MKNRLQIKNKIHEKYVILIHLITEKTKEYIDDKDFEEHVNIIITWK